MNTTSKLRKLILAALMAALVFVITFTVRIPIPMTQGGYLNLGDVMIYLGAYLLGGPAGAGAAAIGSGFADLAAGAPLYIIPTTLIKGCMGLLAGLLMKKRTFPLYLAAVISGGAVMTGGYALFELFFFRGVNGIDGIYALASLPFNALQWLGGSIVALALYPAVKNFDRQLSKFTN